MEKSIEKIRKIVESATAGPWRVTGFTSDWDVEADRHVLGGNTDHMFFRREDALFVVCARSEMPALLDQVLRMSARIADLERRLTDAPACNEAQAGELQTLTTAEPLATQMRSLVAENGRLRAALEVVEWAEYERRCPWCLRWFGEGHAADCQRQAALGNGG